MWLPRLRSSGGGRGGSMLAAAIPLGSERAVASSAAGRGEVLAEPDEFGQSESDHGCLVRAGAAISMPGDVGSYRTNSSPERVSGRDVDQAPELPGVPASTTNIALARADRRLLSEPGARAPHRGATPSETRGVPTRGRADLCSQTGVTAGAVPIPAGAPTGHRITNYIRGV